jgi:hypothetical protein
MNHLASQRRFGDEVREVRYSVVGFRAHGESGLGDGLVAAAAPARSLVINASVLGKDLPGSSVAAAVRFPVQAVVGDRNYRGDLVFSQTARCENGAGGLRIHDGWCYLLPDRTDVAAQVSDVAMSSKRWSQPARIAERLSRRAVPNDHALAGVSDA